MLQLEKCEASSCTFTLFQFLVDRSSEIWDIWCLLNCVHRHLQWKKLAAAGLLVSLVTLRLVKKIPSVCISSKWRFYVCIIFTILINTQLESGRHISSEYHQAECQINLISQTNKPTRLPILVFCILINITKKHMYVSQLEQHCQYNSIEDFLY